MLRYLTHKLRTQSLNETETYHVKTDDDRDSGTESDDEGAEIEELQKYMESIISLDSSRHSEHHRRSKRHHQHLPSQVTAEDDGAASSPADAPPSRPPHHRHHHHHRRRTSHHRSSPALADSALPSDSDHNVDHHSSEEELEVINSGSPTTPRLPQPEKRKWDCSAPLDDEQTLGDDDENNCPVEFRTSPPAHAHKPSKCLRQAHIPAHELCSVSPRKRHRRTPTGQAIQRPCLDFEKMQQINRVRLL
ncbi:uncharacterized protein LOC129222798 [Uloborus diversus]|uniref:uncharacterized protein LOC129222798 n=1 Tax=Uloborus diversus TaxID=327109 RepID=UPI00240A5300|nr:uncharacterized protein LOC129222798 [Uloborus diversus]